MNQKKKWFNMKFLTANLAAFVVAIGGMATVTACTTLFHEKKVPQKLIENHPFMKK